MTTKGGRVKNRGKAIIVVLSDAMNIDELVNSTDYQIYFFDPQAYKPFENVDHTTLLELSESDKRTINYDTLDKLKSIGNVQLEGKPLLDRLTVDKFCFWYYNRFRIYFDTRNVRYQTELIDRVLNDHDEVEVHSHYSGLLDYYVNDDRVHVNLVRTNVKQEREFRYLFNFTMSVAIRSVIGLFRLRRFRKHHHIVVTTPTQFSKTRKEKRTSTNNYYGGILENCDKHNIAILDQLMFPKLRGKNPIVRIGHILHGRPYMVIGGEFVVLFYALARPSVWRKVKKQRQKLKNAYNVVKELDDPVHRLMLGRLARMHATSFLYLMQFHAYRKLFRKGDIKTVTTIDENSPNPKSILDGAKANGIKTIGIQHGSIHNLHPSYMYAAYEEGFAPVPHYTLLWGEYFKELLTKDSAYDSEQLGVIGQLRLDSLFTDTFKNNDRSEKYFEEGKTSVLFASQPQRDPLLRKRAAIDVINSCKGKNNIQLIIKIHPNEEKSYYEDLAQELGSEVTVIKNEANLYHVLMRSNIVITCFSTVGAEAIFLRKPLIILDHLEQDVLGYISRGVALKAISAHDLAENIQELIDLDYATDQESYNKFIADFTYKIDGKVAERYHEFITSLSHLE